MYRSILQVVAVSYLFTSFIKGEMDYEIVVPEFICGRNRGLVNQKDTTTIQFVGEGKMDFFKVNFDTLSNPCRNVQRCNLIAWKVIRQLEKYLNASVSSEKNAVEFNNSMLVPGFKYIFNVSVSQGQDREEKQIVLNFLDNHVVDSASKPLASVILLGVSSIETHITYILNAKISICSDIPDFYFRWELFAEADILIKTFPERSSELNIPPFTFHGGKQYTIICYLINLSNNEVLAEKMHSLRIQDGMRNTLVVKLPMVYTTVQVQQPIHIRPFIRDLANEGAIKKIWSCVHKNEDLCANNRNDELYIEGGFLNEGEYKISLTLIKNFEVETASSLIRVLKDVPSIEINTIETPVLPNSGIRIRANIDELRTLCTVQWRSEEGPHFLDLSSIPGDANEVHYVAAKRDLFLKELQEFSLDLVNKEYDFIIPPASDQWKGLPNKEEDYKLQMLLEVKCPTTLLEEMDEEIELSAVFSNNTINVSALIEIEIAVSPKLKTFEVIPNSGVALETIFTFQCEAVESIVTPLYVYKFGYILGDRKFVFSNQLGFRKAETVLPHDDAVKTFVEVCKGFNYCDLIFGPTIQTSLPVDINENVFAIFKQNLNTEDYYKAFGYALTILTLNTLSTTEVNEINIKMSSQIVEKIQYLINTYNTHDENWGKRVNKLINEIKDFRKEISFSEDVLDGLSKLRDKLLIDEKGKLLVLRRELLPMVKRTVTYENFKSYIDVSDLIISSSSDKDKIETEKQLLETKINEFLGILCTQLYQTQQAISLEYENVIVVLEKLSKQSYSNVHVIPFDGNSWNVTAEVKLDAEAIENIGKNKLCLGKMVFKNFFNKQDISYVANIFDGDSESIVLQPIPSTILLPINEYNIRTHSTPQCIIYNNQWQPNCSLTKSISGYVECHCSTTGVFFLDYENILDLTTISLNVVTEDIKSIETTTQSTETAANTPEESSEQSTINILPTIDLVVDNGNKDTETTVTEEYHTIINSVVSATLHDITTDSTTSETEDSTQITYTISEQAAGIDTNSPTAIEINDHLDNFTEIFTTDFIDLMNSSSWLTTATFSNTTDAIEVSTDNNYANGNDVTKIFEVEDKQTTVNSVTNSPTQNPHMLTTITESAEVTTNTPKAIEVNFSDIPSILPTIGLVTTENSTNGISNTNEPTQEITTEHHIQTELTKKVSTETTQNGIKFTTSPLTVLTGTTTTKPETTVGNKYGGVIQAGINGSFFTNFSLNFLLNTTFG